MLCCGTVLNVLMLYKGVLTLWRFPFDQKFRFKISKISRGKWNSKSGNFPVGYTSPVGQNRSIQFQTKIYRREVLQTESFLDGTVISNHNGPTEKSGPPRKVDLLFRKFSGWTEPFHSVLDRNFRKFWLKRKRCKSADEILKCGYSNESCGTVLSSGQWCSWRTLQMKFVYIC